MGPPALAAVVIILFAAIAFWAYRPANKRRFERDAQIPLKDDRPEK